MEVRNKKTNQVLKKKLQVWQNKGEGDREEDNGSPER
jgi:hypothetical protein